MKPRRRKSAVVVRWLHTYVSLIAFATLVFFSATGLTLNHAEWFEGEPVESEYEGEIADLARADLPGDPGERRLALIGDLRVRHGLEGYLEELEADEGRWDASLRRPGYTADISVDEDEGSYAIYESREGAWTIVNDLHKGRHATSSWKWLIDGSAVLLVLVGVTGIWLLLYLKRVRFSGLLAAAAGTVVFVFFMTLTL